MREDIIHAHTSTSETTGTTHPGVSELVVTAPFIVIAQHIVRLGCLLELLLCLLVTRVLIRMILQCQFAIRFFYFSSIGIFRHAQHFIIISLFHYHAILIYSPTTTFAKRITLSFK